MVQVIFLRPCAFHNGDSACAQDQPLPFAHVDLSKARVFSSLTLFSNGLLDKLLLVYPSIMPSCFVNILGYMYCALTSVSLTTLRIKPSIKIFAE